MRRVGATSDDPFGQQFRVLCVCTGNVYRSRIAEDEFRLSLRTRLGQDAERFLITSAGTRATTGAPLAPDYLRALERLGVDPAGLGPTRHLEAVDIRAADLVLGADRGHRSAVLALVPGAMRRTFVLGELARIVAAAVDRAAVADPASGGDPVIRAREVVAAAARHRGAVPAAGADDIADPWAQPHAVLELAARQVREAVARTVDVLVGARDADLGRQ